MCDSAILLFLERHDDGRLRQTTLDLRRSRPTTHTLFEVVLWRNDTIVCVAGAITLEQSLRASYMVTHCDYRRQGLGTLALSLKVAHLRRLGVPYEAGVAADNIASLGTCLKAGLVITGERTRTRSSGVYTQYVLHPLPEQSHEKTTKTKFATR